MGIAAARRHEVLESVFAKASSRRPEAAGALAATGMLLTSGLPAREYIRSLCGLVRRLFPCTTLGFFWSDANGEMADAFCENAYFLASEVVLSCQRFQMEDPDNWPSFTENVQAGPVTGYLLPYQNERFYGSHHFDFTYGRINVRHILDAVVHDGERPFGCLLFMRAKEEGPFDDGEVALARDIADLMTSSFTELVGEIEGRRLFEAGVAVVGSDGALRYVDQAAHQSLWMMSRPAEGGMPFGGEDRIEALARPMLDLAAQAEATGKALEAQVSSFWGPFAMRADPAGGDIVVRFTQSLPSECFLAETLADSGLPPRRVMIAWLLSAGLSRKEIAARLGLSADTVNEHISALFGTMRVHSSIELVARLLA